MCSVVGRAIVLHDDKANRREAEEMNYQMHFDPYLIEQLMQRREELLREAQRRSLAKQAKEDRGTRFELGRVGSALSGILSLLR
jgi:hypothetical protein